MRMLNGSLIKGSEICVWSSVHVHLRGRWILWLGFTLIGLMIDDRRGCTGLEFVIDLIRLTILSFSFGWSRD